MGVRATWSSPKHVDAEVTDSFEDQYNQTLDDDNLALVLCQDEDCFVIEGTHDELTSLLERLKDELEGWLEQ